MLHRVSSLHPCTMEMDLGVVPQLLSWVVSRLIHHIVSNLRKSWSLPLYKHSCRRVHPGVLTHSAIEVEMDSFLPSHVHLPHIGHVLHHVWKLRILVLEGVIVSWLAAPSHHCWEVHWVYASLSAELSVHVSHLRVEHWLLHHTWRLSHEHWRHIIVNWTHCPVRFYYARRGLVRSLEFICIWSLLDSFLRSQGWLSHREIRLGGVDCTVWRGLLFLWDVLRLIWQVEAVLVIWHDLGQLVAEFGLLQSKYGFVYFLLQYLAGIFVLHQFSHSWGQ